ncbi:hypothetical protein [uncultured Methanoregula sp.]|uniref:hypothetical protein n=1 Tax=uncultured Methanoregula sp. TaxID=1005933 RepID=UPI002AAB1DBA|nr:hypothetical protein [uncultured Methanoregula sp.]
MHSIRDYPESGTGGCDGKHGCMWNKEQTRVTTVVGEKNHDTMHTTTSITGNTGDEIPVTRTAGEKTQGLSGLTGPWKNEVKDAGGSSRPDYGEQKTGRNTTDTGKARTKSGTSPRPKLAARATALRGLSISRPLEPKNSLRRQTLLDIYSKDSEIPYLKLDAAIRDIVCALMERQDRMNEVLFCKLNDLEYRVGDLEEDHTAGGSRI